MPDAFDIAILAVVLVATKEYHTSSSGLPLHGDAAIVCVAPAVLPVVLVQVTLCVSVTALAQSSLAGSVENVYLLLHALVSLGPHTARTKKLYCVVAVSEPIVCGLLLTICFVPLP